MSVERLTNSVQRLTLRNSGLNLGSLLLALPSPRIKLRDYQVAAVNSVLQALQSGVSRPAVVLATGGGKTIVIAHIIPKIIGESKGRTKTLVLAHKEELIRQAAKTIREVNPELKVDIDMQRLTPSDDADVIVGSVPTLVRMSRLEKYRPEEFKAIILDECHHATARSWTKILEYFNAIQDLKVPILGFTATFERSDGVGLGSVFQKVVYERNLLQMIEKGELCDARFLTMKVDLDLDDVKTHNGDYMASKLSEVMNDENINLQVAMAYKALQEKYNLKSTLVFCVDVEHCKTLCGVLQANGVNAQYVTGNTVKHERKAILDDFKAGNIRVLCNVLVFTEGTDIPNIDSLVLARPTKSRPLLTQMIGRGLRLHHNKDYCHIIDMAGSMKLGVLSVPHLFDLPASHHFTKKSIKDLADDKKELTDAEMQATAKARAESVDKMLALQNLIRDLTVGFDTVDGFAAMFNPKGLMNDDIDDTLQLFREDYNFWVRLEYNVWGTQFTMSDSYYTILRDEEDEIFTLVHVDVNFDKKRPDCQYRTIRKNVISVGSLTSVLSVANNIARLETRHLPTFEGQPATQTQCKYITRRLDTKVTNLYGRERWDEFEQKVAHMSKLRASRLIFAIKYSVNSLWVKWEINKLLGTTPKEMTKKGSLVKKLEKLQLTTGLVSDYQEQSSNS